MRHVYECPVRWADLDLLGHVNNVVYVDYLQEARVDMLRVHAPDRRVDDLAEGVVVVRHQVTYLAPLTFRFRPVSIECWVTEIRAASFTMAYEVVDAAADDRTTYLRASTVLTPYVFGTERPRRLTDEERAGLERLPRAGRAGAARLPTRGAAPRRGPLPGPGPLLRRRRLRPRQQREVLRVLPGGADRADVTARRGRGRHEAVPGALGLRTVVAQIDVDYHVPILFRRESYDLWTHVERVGTTSMTLVSEICDGEVVLSRARVAVVFWDPEAARPTAPPTALRDRLMAASRGSGREPGPGQPVGPACGSVVAWGFGGSSMELTIDIAAYWAYSQNRWSCSGVSSAASSPARKWCSHRSRASGVTA